MECFNCGANLSNSPFCNACGVDVSKYKKIMYTANRFYNDGLMKANVRDLSGAVVSLRQCLKFNKNHIDARNLLGLIYFETGEAVAGLSEWVISKNIRAQKNIADDYINMIQQNQGRLETINTTVNKFNNALGLCLQDSPDLAVIQLKKVLSLNPKYVKAHQLLALLYIEKGEYEKASKELDRAARIDAGSLITRRYQKEVEKALNPLDEKTKKKKPAFANGASKEYKIGNENIIQPYKEHENSTISTVIHIAIGLVIGLLAAYFLILPAKVNSVRKENASEVSSYGQEIDKKNAEIEELNTKITALEQSNLDLQSNLQQYEGQNGTKNATDYLLGAAYAYIDTNQTDVNVEEYLSAIGQDYIDNHASTEFIELYSLLQEKIGGSVSQSYYDSGLAAYNQMNYDTAIDNLKKAYNYDATSDDALYYLGLAYYDSGNIAEAKNRFDELINTFPTSELVDKARQKLEEIGD